MMAAYVYLFKLYILFYFMEDHYVENKELNI